MPAACPHCHTVYPTGTLYCARDNSRLIEHAPRPMMPPVPPMPAAPPAYLQPTAPATPARGGASPVLIGVLVGAVVALAGGVGLLVMQRSNAPAPQITYVERTPASAARVPPPSTQEGTAESYDVRPTDSMGDAYVPSPPQGRLQQGRPAPSPAPAYRGAASYGPASVITDGKGLLLREGPGRGYDAIGKMLQGDVVTVRGCDASPPGQRWCEVVYGGVRAYAHDEFLRIGAPYADTDSGHEQAFAAARIVNRSTFVDGAKVSHVNLREQPTVDAEVAIRMRPGTPVLVRRCLPQGWSLGGRSIVGSWCFVTASLPGRTISGWASDDALFW